MVTVTRRKFTLEEYHRLGELGFFNSDERVELIRGEVIKMVAKGRLHSVCTTLLVEELVLLIGRGATVRVQEPTILPSNSEPEPDIVIARKRDDNYVTSHPYPEDILLVIEVSDSSLIYDREVKLTLYAESGISNYWIFNLVDKHLEVYSEPYQYQEDKFNYRLKQIYLPDEAVNLPGFSDLTLNLSSVFPI